MANAGGARTAHEVGEWFARRVLDGALEYAKENYGTLVRALHHKGASKLDPDTLVIGCWNDAWNRALLDADVDRSAFCDRMMKCKVEDFVSVPAQKDRPVSLLRKSLDPDAVANNDRAETITTGQRRRLRRTVDVMPQKDIDNLDGEQVGVDGFIENSEPIGSDDDADAKSDAKHDNEPETDADRAFIDDNDDNGDDGDTIVHKMSVQLRRGHARHGRGRACGRTRARGRGRNLGRGRARRGASSSSASDDFDFADMNIIGSK